MNSLRVLSLFLTFFILIPAWFYLLNEVLKAINANDVLWFVYYTYIPATIFVTIISKIEE